MAYDIYKYDYHCSSCDKIIRCHSEGDPSLIHKNIILCSDCCLNLIEPIYRIRGLGGVQHIIFKDVLSSGYNRQNRTSIKNYKKILNELLHKYKFKCLYCHETDKKKLTIDHIVPVSKNGTDDINNLQILCKSCNSKKGAK